MATSSLSIPPSFPKGLRVLLVDEEPSMSRIEAQLQHPDLGYAVTSCCSATEALGLVCSSTAGFDVVLAESKLVAPGESAGRGFIEAFGETPVVLMSGSCSTEEVLTAVRLGAADVLDKPLSLLKLKNIWQHSVRKMMHANSTSCLSDASADGSAPRSRAPSIDCPGTPMALGADMADVFSCGSARRSEDSMFVAAGGSSFFTTSAPDYFEPMAVESAAAQQALPRQATQTSAFAQMVPVQPACQWPELQPGCVWGTPVGGSIAPPLPGAAAAWPQAAQVHAAAAQPPAPHPLGGAAFGGLLYSAPGAQLALPLAPCSVDLPPGFLSGNCVSGRGPIGLKLRKSSSLLSLINSTLGAC